MIRFFHKYLSLIISIQLLLWTVSGIYFAFNKIELVRGEQYLLENQAEDLNLEEVEITFTAKNLSFIKRLDMWIIKAETDSGLIYSDLSGKKLEALDEVSQAFVEVTFDPPWNPEMITSEARKKLGLAVSNPEDRQGSNINMEWE